MRTDEDDLMVMYDDLLNYPYDDEREHVIEWERLAPHMAEVVRKAIGAGLLREQVVISRLTLTGEGKATFERLLAGESGARHLVAVRKRYFGV